MAATDPRRILVLHPAWRIACTVLNIVPLPGLGAVIAGWKNPHTKLRRDGTLQMLLVVFGSWPLIIPGVAGLVWAGCSAYRIQRDTRHPPAWSQPAPGSAPPVESEPEGRTRRRPAWAQRLTRKRR